MKKLLSLIMIVLLGIIVFQSGILSTDQAIHWSTNLLSKTVDGLAAFFTGLQARLDEEREDVLLVNDSHPLPNDYDPGELVCLYEQTRSFQLARADLYLSSEAFEAAERMFAAAAQSGLSGYILTSAYRSRDAQETIYQESQPGLAQKPGCSEHETGLAFDVTVRRDSGDFSDTPHCQWLLSHCYEYGFIQRYPEGKESVTGISYEPWHYRYVGEKAAYAIYRAGCTLEEYCEPSFS